MSFAQSNTDDLVFVGIPCYNRPEGLADTIRCLREQSHPNWTALVCDNASSDPEVRQVAERAAADDARIQYHRHERNLGAVENFRYAARRGDAPFFMWASDDDLWHPEFMAANLEQLRRKPAAQLAFCSINVINEAGEFLFLVERFSRFQSTGDRIQDVRRYLDDPEISGKANMFYSLYRTPALQACIEECWDDAHSDLETADCVFLFAFLSRYPAATHGGIHLTKRQPTSGRHSFHRRHPRSYRAICPRHLESYIQRHRLVAPSEQLARLAESVIRRRNAQRFLYRLPILNRFLPA